MKTDAQKSPYWKLEQAAEPISTFRNKKLKGWLARIGKFIIRYLTTQDCQHRASGGLGLKKSERN